MYVRVNVYMYLCMIFFRSFEKTVIDVKKPSPIKCPLCGCFSSPAFSLPDDRFRRPTTKRSFGQIQTQTSTCTTTKRSSSDGRARTTSGLTARVTIQTARKRASRKRNPRWIRVGAPRLAASPRLGRIILAANMVGTATPA